MNVISTKKSYFYERDNCAYIQMRTIALNFAAIAIFLLMELTSLSGIEVKIKYLFFRLFFMDFFGFSFVLSIFNLIVFLFSASLHFFTIKLFSPNLSSKFAKDAKLPLPLLFLLQISSINT